jgi:hypothetical protein
VAGAEGGDVHGLATEASPNRTYLQSERGCETPKPREPAPSLDVVTGEHVSQVTLDDEVRVAITPVRPEQDRVEVDASRTGDPADPSAGRAKLVRPFARTPGVGAATEEGSFVVAAPRGSGGCRSRSSADRSSQGLPRRWKEGSVSASELPRLAVRPEEAAEILGVSRSFFFEHVLPELRVVRRNSVRLITLRSLYEWLEQNSSRAVESP